MEFVLTPWEIIVRILLSALIGFVVGLDREKHSSAGVRTHMILAVGVCVITLIQVDLTAESILWYIDNPEFIGVVGTDTGRLTAQIVSGIGFLGSGLILVRNDRTVDGICSIFVDSCGNFYCCRLWRVLDCSPRWRIFDYYPYPT